MTARANPRVLAGLQADFAMSHGGTRVGDQILVSRVGLLLRESCVVAEQYYYQLSSLRYK